MPKKSKKPPPAEEDAEQSKRFMDLARDLEAAGDLSPTGDAFERAMRKIAPEKKGG